MDNAAPAPAPGGGGARREPSIDPVKAQGIMTSVTKKEKLAAKLWKPTWGFTAEEYRDAVRSASYHLAPKQYLVEVDPSPFPLPPTSAAIIGHRATCPLERYGRLVKTDRDYPTRPPLKPGQIYDPYKQTLVFLGSVDGDPISYKLPISRHELTAEMLARPNQLSITPFDFMRHLGTDSQ
ncbi:Uncharacterized protein OBRU01_00418 [Operophtera brumata]|uniref:Uncharacterized protein n=1 Tax=Operophtera brumata TaxID=104452 RepID=A0A0L7LRG3_OPEBR|nr:Uncharacterized protein OBRU01_00418 [Operophtera brumata]